MSFSGRHIISMHDLSKDDLLCILRVAKELENTPQPDLLSGFLMSTLFFEPSTRTRLSFEAAMARLGGRVIGFADASSTSQKKGESLADTIRMAEQYTDVIVMRHPNDGAARLATQVSSVPIINGGDGSNQHPTQTCLDLYTISKLFPQLLDAKEELTIAFAGDLRYGRTVHSLLEALSHFRVRILTSAPKGLAMPEHLVEKAQAHGLVVENVDDLQQAVEASDVLYMTRLQEERFPDPVEFDHVKATYRLNANMLSQAKDSLRVLHPLPRVNEIASDVDQTKHAHYFPQAGNGIPVRQAILSLVLGKINA
ncbi:MAG: aspartate carbamoyltransferase [Planctomycetes bacterium]|nr:aspartate carbamoyltransferase [Planctomycetota bacterium]